MKNQLTALCIAMPLLFTAVQSHAEYVFKFPMEEATGGNLPNGSIIIVKNNAGGGVVVPPIVELDPLEPESPACDPFDVSSKDKELGKEKIFPTQFRHANGIYRACELKKTLDSTILAKFTDGISIDTGDECKNAKYVNADSKCHVNAQHFSIDFKMSKDASGNIVFSPFNNNLKMIYETNTTANSVLTNMKRVVVNGVECNNYQAFAAWLKTCTYNVSYNSLVSLTGKPFVVEYYR